MFDYPKQIISVFALLTLFLIYVSTQLKFDYEFERFFPINDSDIEFFLKYREKFENDNDFVLIAIDNKKGIFDETFLKKAKKLNDTLKSYLLITKVNSPFTLKYPVINDFGAIEVPFLHWNNPELYEKDSIRIFKSKQLVGTFFSTNAQSLAFVIENVENPSKAKSDSLADFIENNITALDFDDYHIAGKIHAQRIFVQKMQFELAFYMSMGIVLLTLFLWFTFRNWWAVFVPLMVVLFAIIWIMGFMGLAGKKMDVLITLLPLIMFVVGISDVIHIYSRYIEELRKGLKKIDALSITLREIGAATFLTSFTTAIGFFSLLTTNIIPIREFGIIIGVGVMLAFVIAFTFFPAVLILKKEPKISNQIENKLRWRKFLFGMFKFTMKNPKIIYTFSFILLILSIYGISKIKIDSTLLDDISRNDKLRLDFVFFEENYAGVRPFEMYFKINSNKDIFDKDVLAEFNELETYLSDSFKTGFLISPLMAVKGINQALNGGNAAYFKLPEDSAAWEKAEKLMLALRHTKDFRKIYIDSTKEGRISGKMRDEGSYTILKRTELLNQFIQKNIDPSILSLQITGTSPLIDKNNLYLATNMVQGLLVAIFVISLIVGLMFKSFRMVIIALVPNLLPLLMLGGIMGFSGIDLKISTSIIFTIAFGIAVDDSIHLLSKLKIELNKGRNLFFALFKTYLSTGKAVIMTTIILSSGFASLFFSGFQSTFYVGVLISLTLFLAVLFDLFLLPILIWHFYKLPRKRN